MEFEEYIKTVLNKERAQHFHLLDIIHILRASVSCFVLFLPSSVQRSINMYAINDIRLKPR